MSDVEYFFKRNGEDNSVTLFIETPPEWFGKSIELIINQEQLAINISDTQSNQEYKTKKLEPLLLDALISKSNTIIFCNDTSVETFEQVFPPLKSINTSKKLKY